MYFFSKKTSNLHTKIKFVVDPCINYIFYLYLFSYISKSSNDLSARQPRLKSRKINQNSNRNLNKLIRIPIETRTINRLGTVCTRSERVQNWASHVGLNKIYILSVATHRHYASYFKNKKSYL